ncbi:kinase suppressor of Ras 1 isoform X1 [Hemibagrus wyckioides]|uniref:kinase suppressor of Ras 1 isoform X1 n=2 Tax=Hemibagrus wyckioides TaxID=337641 RepID=UPI00266D431D|nr:kinase suppressor of Ras 1 isoform X1 [Hemibagrus wyckioides]
MDGEDGNMVATRDEQVEGNSADTSALQQCQLLQNIIDITISNLQGLRTKCAASNDLTQHEIRTLEVKLVKYISKQLQCKQRVPVCERSLALSTYPHLVDWLHTINLRPEFIESVAENLSLDALLQMSGSQVQETMRKLGSSVDECSRITAALSCLKSTSTTSTSRTGPWTGRELKEDGIPWIVEPARCDISANQLSCFSQSPQPYSPNPAIQVPFTPTMPGSQRSVSVSAVSSLDCPTGPHATTLLNGLGNPFYSSPQLLRHPLGTVSTPPPTPPTFRNDLLKPPHTPPPPSKLRQLFPTLPRSKSHTQLANRIEEPSNKNVKKNKMLLNVHVNVQDVRNGFDDSPSRSPLLSVPSPQIIPNTRIQVESPTLKDKGRSPQAMRRDYGLTITHRFSTKSWFSQTCVVCKKNMLFGVKCKHCKLKCHNKCTKEAPQCQTIPISKIRRTESVPSDINNQVERLPSATQFGTLPKTLNKKDLPPPVIQPDSSSNPSSTTSSTPSSPAFSSSNPPSATPPANPSPKGPNDGRFHFPASCHYQFRQQFIFPDISSSQHLDGHDLGETEQVPNETITQAVRQEEAAVNDDVDGEEAQQEHERQDEAASYGESEGEEDELDDLPSCTRSWKGPISRKVSQTSVYLQEWNVPFEQVELGDLIGKGRWGKVYRGRWHGEVAVRLLEIDGNNQDHLKLFKKEVMNYRQTRHENVVLFMGACMNPPQLAIITSFCKGRTLHSVVRDSKSSLDINKTRQIAQEIVKGMGYLHAKDIVHKDLKSKNVFYDNNKVVITDFGLFGVSGVVQEDRRENELKLPQGWIYYLAPEIVQKMCPGNEDLLPFSKAADVYAFGTIWYELQVRDWPIKTQPAEAAIWLLGSGEGIKRQLAQISLGKEITEILCACWSFKHEERPRFFQLADLLEKLPKLNRRLSHPGHFWKSTEYVS